ncbi:hypothetical protein BGZ83_010254 [Gryganskiella cystojenkinii]|nr:hypothetical protein BGZ83_010254 [Gryganskiella cystojenkinii]
MTVNEDTEPPSTTVGARPVPERQEFKVFYRSFQPHREILMMDTRKDPVTGKNVVLWSDIQRICANALYVLHNGTVVPFLKDRTSQQTLIPERFEHCPDRLILVARLCAPEPMLRVSGRPHQMNASRLFSNPASTRHMFLRTLSTPKVLMSSTLAKCYLDSIPAPPLKMPEPLVSNTPPSSLTKRDEIIQTKEYYQKILHSSRKIEYIQAFPDKITKQLVVYLGDIERVFGEIQFLRDDGKAISLIRGGLDDEYLKPLRVPYKEHSTFEVVLASQQPNSSSLHSKERSKVNIPAFPAYDYNSNIISSTNVLYQNDIKKIIAMTALFSVQDHIPRGPHSVTRSRPSIIGQVDSSMPPTPIPRFVSQSQEEPPESPCPRLFIVLPKSMRRGKFPTTAPRFRLFFLCDCGDDPTGPTSHVPEHDGYDLDRPQEFFEKFGGYLLTMMHMFKDGIDRAATFTSPTPSPSEKFMIKASKKDKAQLKTDFASLVVETITYLENLDSGGSGGRRMSVSESSIVSVLSDHDLRQLESFLVAKGNDDTRGNLYRDVGERGKAKWVCKEHSSLSDEDLLLHRGIARRSGATYTERLGKLHLKLWGRGQARQFYNELTKADKFQELHIELDWDTDLEDLKDFTNAVRRARITSLRLVGERLVGGVRKGEQECVDKVDISLNSTAATEAEETAKFSQLMKLLASPDIRSLELVNFDNFLGRVHDASFEPASQIRYIGLDFDLSFNNSLSKKAFAKILEMCPGLRRLSVKMADLPESQSQDTLANILTKNQNLVEVEVSCPVQHHVELLSKVVRAREKVVTRSSLVALKNLLLHDTNGHGVHMIATFGTGAPEITTNISTCHWGTDKIQPTFEHHGGTIYSLQTHGGFDDYLALLLATSVKQQSGSKLRRLDLNLLGLSKQGIQSMIEVIDRSDNLAELTLNCHRLHEPARLDIALELVSQCRRRITGLSLQGNTTKWMAKFKNWFPSRGRFPSLTRLSIDAMGANMLHSDYEMPKLDDEFTAEWEGQRQRKSKEIMERLAHDKSMTDWIIKMVSRSSSQATAEPLQPADAPHAGMRVTASRSVVGLVDIDLRNLEVEAKVWKAILDALDFTSLERLDVEGSNFGLCQLEYLSESLVSVEGQSSNAESAPLMELSAYMSQLYSSEKGFQEQETIFRGKAVLRTILCSKHDYARSESNIWE